jgi:hypothetical protein
VAKENYFQSGPVFVINDPEKPLFFHLGLRDCFSCGSLGFLKKKKKKRIWWLWLVLGTSCATDDKFLSCIGRTFPRVVLDLGAWPTFLTVGISFLEK